MGDRLTLYLSFALTLSWAFSILGANAFESNSKDGFSSRFMLRGKEGNSPLLSASRTASDLRNARGANEIGRRQMAETSPCTRYELDSFETDLRDSLEVLKSDAEAALKSVSSIPACSNPLESWAITLADVDSFIQEPDFALARGKLKAMARQLRQCYNSRTLLPESSERGAIRKVNSTLGKCRGAAFDCYNCAQNFFETEDVAPAPAPAGAPLPGSAAPSTDADSDTDAKANELHPLDVPITEKSPELIADSDAATESTSVSKDAFALSYENHKDARLRSVHSYSYGVFSVDFKCPSHFEGLQASFFLSTGADDPKREGMAFEFLGNNLNRSRANAVVKGYGRPYTIDFGWDCSADFHTYTFSWTPTKLMWLVDDVLLRVADASDVRDAGLVPTSDRMYVYASFRRPRSWGVGTYDPAKAPFTAEFQNLRIGQIREGVTLIPPELPDEPFPMAMMAIPYCKETVYTDTSETVISWGEHKSCGGNAKSLQRYNYGRFTGFIKCAEGNTSGLVTSFYLSSFEGHPRIMDEIDFEFLGRDKKIVQTNFWVNGKGGNEVLVPLGFDCSHAFHNYTINWTPDFLQWYIDSKLVRTEFRKKVEGRGRGYPKKPSFLYLSVWNANNLFWTGKYNGKDAPFFMRYKDIEIYSPLS